MGGIPILFLQILHKLLYPTSYYESFNFYRFLIILKSKDNLFNQHLHVISNEISTIILSNIKDESTGNKWPFTKTRKDKVSLSKAMLINQVNWPINMSWVLYNKPSYRKKCWRNDISKTLLGLFFLSPSITRGTHLWPAKEGKKVHNHKITNTHTHKYIYRERESTRRERQRERERWTFYSVSVTVLYSFYKWCTSTRFKHSSLRLNCS